MRTVRQSVFETNSSSAHCVTFVDTDQYKDFCDKKIVYSRSDRMMHPAADMYGTFVSLVNDAIKYGCAPERETRALIPTKDEFAAWVQNPHNMLPKVSVCDAGLPEVKTICNKFFETLDSGNFLVHGSCDDIAVKKEGQDLIALSMYRGE